MNRKLVFLVVTLLVTATSFTAVAPVVAEPAQKISVTARTYSQVNVPVEERPTKGGIVHTVISRTGNVQLNITGQNPMEGTLSEVVHQMKNTKTGEIVVQNFDCSWTFEGGSFEGVKQTRITIGPPLIVEQHVVFQGTGIFAGCTLKLSQENPPTAVYKGVLIDP